MTGQIIPFENYRTCEATASRRSGRAPDESACGPSIRRGRNLKLQLARISRLLDDLEQLTPTARMVSPEIMGQDDIEDDPQPDVDDEMLKRLYSELVPDA